VKRQAGAVTLHVRGRDVEEAEKALEFNKSTCKWAIVGEAADVRQSAEREHVIEALKRAGEPLSVAQIMAEAQIKSRGAADMLLRRMLDDGLIVKPERGKYALEALDCGISSQAIGKPSINGTSNDLTHLTRGSESDFLGPIGDSLDDLDGGLQ
jgi:hypothetical protein